MCTWISRNAHPLRYRALTLCTSRNKTLSQREMIASQLLEEEEKWHPARLFRSVVISSSLLRKRTGSLLLSLSSISIRYLRALPNLKKASRGRFWSKSSTPCNLSCVDIRRRLDAGREWSSVTDSSATTAKQNLNPIHI